MRLRTFIAVATLALAAGADSVPFKIALPEGFKDFTTQTQKSNSANGVIETTNWIARSNDGQAVIVSVSQMPKRILNPEKLLASTRDALAKSVNATIEHEEKVPGDTAERVLMSGKGAFLRARLATTKDRLVQLIYVGRSDAQRASAPVEQMFGSFALNATP